MATAAIKPGFKLDATGFAIAVVAHAVLLYILTRDPEGAPPPEPAAMEVSFVEETGPVSAAPVTSAEPAPTFGEEFAPDAASGAEASEPAPVTPPVPEPVRPPVETTDRARPDLTRTRVPVRPTPPVRQAQPQRPSPPAQTRPRPTPPAQTRPAQPRPGPTGPSFADVARNVGGGAPSRRQGPPAAAPAQLSGAERQQIARNISGLIAPCANRARPPNALAQSITVDLRVTVSRDGVPTGHRLMGSRGTNPNNEDYVDDVEAVAMRAVRSCASRIATLPAVQYENGWRTFNYRFNFN